MLYLIIYNRLKAICESLLYIKVIRVKMKKNCNYLLTLFKIFIENGKLVKLNRLLNFFIIYIIEFEKKNTFFSNSNTSTTFILFKIKYYI